MKSADVVIVGGGPSGSFASISLGSILKNSNLILLEQREKSGSPPHCSGLIGISGLTNLRLVKSLENKTDINRINAAEFVSPLGNSLIVNRKKKELFVVDRPKLDYLLAKQAQKLGTSFFYRHKVKNISHLTNKQGYIVSGLIENSNSFKIQTKIIISAEGHHPKLPQQIGLSIPSGNWFFPALQYEMSNIDDIEQSTVEIYMGQKYAPGFFAWLIPINDAQARIGLAIHPLLANNTRAQLNYLIHKHPILSPKLKRAKVLNSWGGFVPASGPINKTFSDGFLVVGDAAGQTKATTGGGFNIGSYCGYLAGKTAAKAIIRNKTSSSIMQEYQKAWRAYFEPDLTLMKLLRRTLSFTSDPVLEQLFKVARETDLEENLQKVSNIDLHGKEILKYSLKPITIKKSLKISPYLLKSFLRGIFD
ncbi:geranylgeranyl reductase family protein [Candidatus Hodarchaeum mangrovi]